MSRFEMHPSAEEDISSHYALFVTSLSALDLAATQQGLAELDFHAQLAFDSSAKLLYVRWQPDAVLHPEYPVQQSLGQPAEQLVTFAFARAKAELQAEIIDALTEEGEEVPALLRAETEVAHVKVRTELHPTSKDAFLWSLLGELTATAPDPSKVVLYDEDWVLTVPSDEARDYMEWRDMVETIEDENKLNEQNAGSESLEESGSGSRGGKPGNPVQPQAPANPIHTSRAPGEQASGQSGTFLVAVLAALAVGVWYWMRG
ncbi:hypothetical protein [Ottowia thiooxydans]|uniref:Uncharacterized protein n=1 Tax=Ottowia thiooxydans TaxID=219182 RepID=A0ABV2Q465_9BURK